MNRIGAVQAEQIRTAAAELVDLPDLARTSALREIFYDLGEALSDLCNPISTLLAEFAETRPTTGDDDPDLTDTVEHLRQVAASLSYCADNL